MKLKIPKLPDFVWPAVIGFALIVGIIYGGLYVYDGGFR